jgi:hypothetical protein
LGRGGRILAAALAAIWLAAGLTALVIGLWVRGENLRERPRFPGNLQSDPARAQMIDEFFAPEREFELKLERWLTQHKKK